jgi:hypothetical protein
MVAVVSKGAGPPQASGERGPERAPRRIWSRLLKAIHGLIKWDRYEPARHYMRGPGPASSQRSARIVGDDE